MAYETSVITVPVGYRKLAAHEIIKPGDKIFADSKEWREVELSVGLDARDVSVIRKEQYRFLKPDDVIRPGDQFRCDFGWEDSKAQGERVEEARLHRDDILYRRKIGPFDPMPDYICLDTDDILEPEDEKLMRSGNWRKTASAGSEVPPNSTYRRKINKAELPGKPQNQDQPKTQADQAW
jgi:hypothetical protein